MKKNIKILSLIILFKLKLTLVIGFYVVRSDNRKTLVLLLYKTVIIIFCIHEVPSINGKEELITQYKIEYTRNTGSKFPKSIVLNFFAFKQAFALRFEKAENQSHNLNAYKHENADVIKIEFRQTQVIN